MQMFLKFVMIILKIRLPDEVNVLQSIKDDSELEQEDKETDTNNDNDNISFKIAKVNNDKIIKKKGPDKSEELRKGLLTIPQTLDNLIESVVDDVVNKSVGAKKSKKRCN